MGKLSKMEPSVRHNQLELVCQHWKKTKLIVHSLPGDFKG